MKVLNWVITATTVLRHYANVATDLPSFIATARKIEWTVGDESHFFLTAGRLRMGQFFSSLACGLQTISSRALLRRHVPLYLGKCANYAKRALYISTVTIATCQPMFLTSRRGRGAICSTVCALFTKHPRTARYSGGQARLCMNSEIRGIECPHPHEGQLGCKAKLETY